MTQIADAPWVRAAESFGMPEAEEIEYSCPVCGAEQPESFCFDRDDEIVGCSCCCRFGDAYQFMADKLAEARKAGGV